MEGGRDGKEGKGREPPRRHSWEREDGAIREGPRSREGRCSGWKRDQDGCGDHGEGEGLCSGFCERQLHLEGCDPTLRISHEPPLGFLGSLCTPSPLSFPLLVTLHSKGSRSRRREGLVCGCCRELMHPVDRGAPSGVGAAVCCPAREVRERLHSRVPRLLLLLLHQESCSRGNGLLGATLRLHDEVHHGKHVGRGCCGRRRRSNGGVVLVLVACVPHPPRLLLPAGPGCRCRCTSSRCSRSCCSHLLLLLMLLLRRRRTSSGWEEGGGTRRAIGGGSLGRETLNMRGCCCCCCSSHCCCCCWFRCLVFPRRFFEGEGCKEVLVEGGASCSEPELCCPRSSGSSSSRRRGHRGCGRGSRSCCRAVLHSQAHSAAGRWFEQADGVDGGGVESSAQRREPLIGPPQRDRRNRSFPEVDRVFCGCIARPQTNPVSSSKPSFTRSFTLPSLSRLPLHLCSVCLCSHGPRACCCSCFGCCASPEEVEAAHGRRRAPEGRGSSRANRRGCCRSLRGSS